MSKYAEKSTIVIDSVTYTLSKTVTRGYEDKADPSTRKTIFIAFLKGRKGAWHRNYTLEAMMGHLEDNNEKAKQFLADKASQPTETPVVEAEAEEELMIDETIAEAETNDEDDQIVDEVEQEVNTTNKFLYTDGKRRVNPNYVAPVDEEVN